MKYYEKMHEKVRPWPTTRKRLLHVCDTLPSDDGTSDVCVHCGMAWPEAPSVTMERERLAAIERYAKRAKLLEIANRGSEGGYVPPPLAPGRVLRPHRPLNCNFHTGCMKMLPGAVPHFPTERILRRVTRPLRMMAARKENRR